MRQLAFALLLLISTGAWAQWTRVGSADYFDFYADLAKIRRQGNIATMWSLFDYKTAQDVRSAALSHMSRDEYDCGEQRTRTLYGSWYPEHMGNGQTISVTTQPAEWKPISLGSVIERLWQVACKR